MKNGSPTSSVTPNINGLFNHECSLVEAHSIYLIEPRSSDRTVYEALGKAWRQSSINLILFSSCRTNRTKDYLFSLLDHQPINISSEFFIDSTYLTKQK